jgi:hypothetical protein
MKKKSLSVLQFINKHAILHDDNVTYDNSDYRWIIKPYPNKNPGIYFICVCVDGELVILKVGKAEGAKGIWQRLSQYRSSGKNRVEGKSETGRYDRSVITIHLAMQEVYKKYGKKVVMKVYTHEMPKLNIDYCGYTLESSHIRSLEKLLSLQATKEGHSMTLSGQN